jgi:aspartate/methionine/tyrosine aminotransferase
MKLPAFKLEEFMKKYEFSTPYLLCSSEMEGWKMDEILALADPEGKALWENLSLGYTESPGLPLLREEIAPLYSNISPAQVLTFAGAEEGIYCALRTLIDPKGHVITINPCYQSLDTLPEVFGAEVTRIPLDPKKGWQLELDSLKSAFRPNTKLLLLNIPHNPTGALLDKKVHDGVIALARERGTYIFCDEVYRYLEMDESKRLPSLADSYERGITLNVMTKSFGLAGLRIGWLVSQDEAFMQAVSSYKLYTSICNSAPSELLALIALRARHKILKRNREILLHNLNQLICFMEEHQGSLAWVPPQGGTLALVELLRPIENFTEKLIAKMGVLVMPGEIFGIPGNYFRIGLGKRNMAEALKRLGRFLHEEVD